MKRSRFLGATPEVELVLVVCSEDPLTTIERIASLGSIGDFGLKRGDERIIHDVYFDTAEGDLRRRRVNLRLREVDNKTLVTMKESPGLFSRNRDERHELELQWAPESFDRVVSELEARKVRLRPSSKDISEDPVEALRSLGLDIIQDRETVRQTRHVVSKSNTEHLLAELALDSVTYHFGSQDVCLHEVEIESRSKSRGSLSKCRRSLLSLFGAALRPWRWGKLATGRAIERMLLAGSLNNVLVEDRLTPEGFVMIEEFMRRRTSWRRF